MFYLLQAITRPALPLKTSSCTGARLPRCVRLVSVRCHQIMRRSTSEHKKITLVMMIWHLLPTGCSLQLAVWLTRHCFSTQLPSLSASLLLDISVTSACVLTCYDTSCHVITLLCSGSPEWPPASSSAQAAHQISQLLQIFQLTTQLIKLGPALQTQHKGSCFKCTMQDHTTSTDLTQT
jgi:hypothetical protein